MRVDALTVQAFRNLERLEFVPCEGANVLYGDNAQGKTNLLEGLWLFTGGRSFRGAKDSELVSHGAASAALSLRFTAGQREQSARLDIAGRRKATLNGIPQASASKLIGRFCAVIFSPDHLSLIKDGPEARRRFTDAACCQLHPGFLAAIGAYTHTLRQRNSLLKAMRAGLQPREGELLEVFDRQLAQAGAAVRRTRKVYLQALTPYAAHIYEGVSRGKETLGLRYDPGEQTQEELYRAISGSRENDLKVGFSTVGPHRDDVEVTINGVSARAYGSQGQQRSAVLSLKLAEASLLRDGYGERPVILLDDVMSELDPSRQEYVLNHLQDWQVFITCCDLAATGRLAAGKVFHVKHGEVTEA